MISCVRVCINICLCILIYLGQPRATSLVMGGYYFFNYDPKLQVMASQTACRESK